MSAQSVSGDNGQRGSGDVTPSAVSDALKRKGRGRSRRLRLDIPSDRERGSEEDDLNIEKGAEREKSGDAPESSSGKNATSKLPSALQWIPANWTWSSIKPAIRSAIAAWISLVLFVIPKVENAMGQASFLILIAAFLSPPSDSLPAVLERELIILTFVALAWAWVCFGLKMADLARTNQDPLATTTAIFTGEYIQAAPTVIIAVFVFLGSSFFLYIKARQGPGPFLFATIFGCICIDICFTTGALFPYPYYKIGQIIIVPLAIHSGVAILTSIFVFPATASAQFTARFQSVLAPLSTSLTLHRKILKTPVDDPAFSHDEINKAVNQSEGALIHLAASARLLKSDIIWCRFAPTDFAHLHNFARRLAVRANGMAAYFTLIDPTREKFPVTPAPSRPGTPSFTPQASRPHSPDRSGRNDVDEAESTAGGHSTPITPSASHVSSKILAPAPRRRHVHTIRSQSRGHSRVHTHQRFPHYGHSHHHQSHHNLLNSSLLHLAISRSPQQGEQPVGVWESQRYLEFEATHFDRQESAKFTARAIALLSESCDDLLEGCGDALNGIRDWFDHVRDGRFRFWRGREREEAAKERIKKYEDLRDQVSKVLDDFRNNKRLKVLDPYRFAFDPKPEFSSGNEELPPHRYLFHCYVYQYHIMDFAVRLLHMLTEIVRLEKERKRNKLWTPTVGLDKILSWSTWEAAENMDQNDEENPEIIPGMQPAWMEDLGMPTRRDPDALPPDNIFESIMNLVYQGAKGLGQGNALFALKAGLLTIILCIPSFLKSSASFAYRNKFVWAIFMGQLTIARFRGDTTFSLVARIMSTFFGGVVGMAMWYTSTGNGNGSAFGAAAVTGVCYPFFFYARLYWPGPPMTNLIFFVTSALVLGYSYQDEHLLLPSSPGSGFDVAWRRFVLVTVGVTAAFIFSFFPPSTTLRRYQRTSLSTVCTEIGAIYCSILSYANSTRNEDTQEIVQSLIAIRSKLKRSLLLRANVVYEFSLRGRWPAERYRRVLEIQLQIAYCLSHLMSVVEHLDPAWTQAFLRRTRFLDTDFQGDVLAVISMISTSLRTGTPLPQITPCPLVDRFMLRHHGLNVIQAESEDDYGLPRTMTINTLENEQYLTFCVGVSTAFGIITRLDRLMVAVKELVGEQYHIHGIGLRHGTRHGVEMGSRTNSMKPS